MNKLITAGFVRVRRDKLLWICMFFMAAAAAFVIISAHLDAEHYNLITNLDSYFLGCFVLTGMTMPLFCSLFLGTEYSDGTIRNKLTVGRTRASIYLSNLTLMFVAGVVMCAAFIVSATAFGVPMLGGLESNWKTVTLYALCGLATLAAVSAVYTLIAMLCHNKAFSVVISVLTAVVLAFLMSQVMDVLSATEYVTTAVFRDGDFVMEEILNVNYPSPEKRALFELFLDLLPDGQAAQIANLGAQKLWRLPVFALGIFTVTTVSGLYFFKRKDIK